MGTRRQGDALWGDGQEALLVQARNLLRPHVQGVGVVLPAEDGALETVDHAQAEDHTVGARACRVDLFDGGRRVPAALNASQVGAESAHVAATLAGKVAVRGD